MEVKGQGTLELAVVHQTDVVAKRRYRFSEAEAWRRIQVPFDAAMLGEIYLLQMSMEGDLQIDRFMVNKASKSVKAFIPPAPVEIVLALPQSDASDAYIQFNDEPAIINLAAFGQLDKAKSIQMHITNAYGKKAVLPAIVLNQDQQKAPYIQAKIDFQNSLIKTPQGPFRIHAWAVDSTGKQLSPISEMVLYRLPRPVYWGRDAANSAFGVHVNPTHQMLTLAKAIGLNWIRLHDAGLPYIGWYHLEPKPGQWQFFDKQIQRYRDHQLMILGELGTAPPWASHHPGYKINGYFDRFYQPRKMEDWSNYVQTVTQRYRDTICTWDVWNEPWITAWWAVGYDKSKVGRDGYLTSKTPQQDYVRLLRHAHEQVKAIDPAIKLAGLNSTNHISFPGSIGGKDWTEGVMKAGNMAYTDILNYHHYTNINAMRMRHEIALGFQEGIGPTCNEQGQPPKPVWMTEGSAGRDLMGNGFYQQTLPANMQDDEDPFFTGEQIVAYASNLLSMPQMQRIFFYSMHTYTHMGNTQIRWRTFTNLDGYLHPSGAAMAIFAQLAEDSQFHSVLNLGKHGYVMVFKKADGTAFCHMVLHKDLRRQLKIKNDGQWLDLFGNPIDGPQESHCDTCYFVSSLPADQLVNLLKKAGLNH